MVKGSPYVSFDLPLLGSVYELVFIGLFTKIVDKTTIHINGHVHVNYSENGDNCCFAYGQKSRKIPREHETLKQIQDRNPSFWRKKYELHSEEI